MGSIFARNGGLEMVRKEKGDLGNSGGAGLLAHQPKKPPKDPGTARAKVWQ